MSGPTRSIFDPSQVVTDISRLQYEVGVSGALLGDFYYRLSNIDGSRNDSKKHNIQYQGSTITERDSEYVLLAVTGVSENDTDIENTNIHITTSNIFTSSRSSISNYYRELIIETISYFDNSGNSVIGKSVFSDGTFEGDDITKLDKITFTVTGATGKFKNANTIVIEYLNDKTYYPRICKVYS
jgi:hypothetical protein